MGNRLKGVVTAQTQAGEVRLQYSINALCEIEDRAGLSLQEFMAQVEAGHMKALRLFIWGGMVQHQPAVQISDAGALADELGLQEAVKLCKQAFDIAFPQAEGDQGKE